MFELIDSKKIDLLNLNADLYEHSKFKTKHLHLESDNSEKVFMVAFKTVPEDSTGIAHICLLYTSPSPRDISGSRMPSSA